MAADDQTLESGRGVLSGGSQEPTLVAGGAAAAAPAQLEEGERVGRYLVLRKLGAGGMGTVYAAYDPELDRKVALKLVHPGSGGSGEASRTRLLREAQAMARVTHPNVATVHDVGTHRDQVYVAMEFVDGVTLGRWIAAEQRGWARIVEVYALAGAGLAAAHAQNLVHRDFKPDNVMIEDGTGRVVVLDFGLARGSDPGGEPRSGEAADPSSAAASTSTLLSTEVTRAGDVTGTPAYMSPEQFAGGEVSAASDQFSFCVALYEALYGERPFGGESPAALLFAVTQGKLREPPADRNVPGWLRRILLRGLSTDPAGRWPSLDALLAAVERERPRRRRALTWGLAAAAVVATVGAAAFLGSRAGLCTGAEAQLDGVWDEARRGEADAHVAALELPWFSHTWNATTRQLDAYATQWAAGHQDACEATNRRGEQSEAVMDLRMACLSRARVELAATVDRLLQVDAEQARRVHQLMEGLPGLDRCADVAALQAEEEPPDSPETAAAVDELREELARARAGVRMGERGVAADLEKMRERVMAVSYPILHAEYLETLGQALRLEARHEPARESLDAGLELALAHRQWGLALKLLDGLARVTGNDLQQPREGMAHARVAVGLAGQPGIEPASARLARRTLASAYDSAGDYAASLEVYRELLEETPADREEERTLILSGMALVLETDGQFGEAEKVHRQVIEAQEKRLGAEHPSLAVAHSNLGNALMAQHRYPEAEAAQRRALEIDLVVFGPDHPSIAGSHANLGAVLGAAGKIEEARAEMQAVLDIIGEDHPRSGLVIANLGTLAMERDEYEEAERQYRRALKIYLDTIGPEHPRMAQLRSTLGAALDGQGRHAEAETELRESLRLALAGHDEDHPMVAKARERLGSNLLDQGKPGEALPLLERSLARRVEIDAELKTIAITRFLLARALWDSGGDRTRARKLAEEARTEFETALPERVERVTEWLAERE